MFGLGFKGGKLKGGFGGVSGGADLEVVVVMG